MAKKETEIVTTVKITQITTKSFPANKTHKSYEKDAKRMVHAIAKCILGETLSEEDDVILETIHDLDIVTGEDGTLMVQVFKREGDK